MKSQTITLGLTAAVALWGVGCSSSADYSNDPNRTARGAAVGAATGAVLGGVVGSNSDRVSTEQGAAIGAVAGGLAGAAIGHRQDQREAQSRVYSADARTVVQSIPPAPVSEPQETIPPQPAQNAVWIRGHYEYTGAGYQWPRT
jgi:phage tail tape-measure protein